MRGCDTTILNYQNFLFGCYEKYRFIPSDMHEKEKSEKAIAIVRWVIEEMLGWTPQQARDHFGKKEIEAFKLKNIIPHIIIPNDISRTNYDYLMSLVFPEIKYDPTEGVIEMWDEVMSKKRDKFKENIFDDEDGKKRAYKILDEFNRRYIPVSDIESLYKEYSDSAKINKLFRKTSLFSSLSKLYTYPINLLHEMLQYSYPGEEDEYLYSIYLYNSVADSISLSKHYGE